MPIQISEDEKKALAALYGRIKETFKVKKFILFGSRARGEEMLQGVEQFNLSIKSLIESEMQEISLHNIYSVMGFGELSYR